MLITGVVFVAIVIVGAVLMLPRFRGSQAWRAMVTPLASIIGSGFLVLGPILDRSYGYLAPVIMAGLCLFAYLYGAAIRFNIAMRETPEKLSRQVHWLEQAASWALAFAYFVSVAYYLNLFGSFGVDLIPGATETHARFLTSAVFMLILFIGWTRGFRSLERMEYISVSMKLAIIAGLLAGLVLYFGERAGADELVFDAPRLVGWQGLTLAFGLLITVQGFETSRYLGAEYDAPMRIRSMKGAQLLSTAIYLVYVLLVAYVFPETSMGTTETAIIDVMGFVSPVLPILLVIAALAAQFSAAIADTGGSGGLITEQSNNRIPQKVAYALLCTVGLLMTWTADVFQIIGYASRAFAFYYMIQSLIAAVSAYQNRANWSRIVLFSGLAVLAAMIVIFGQSIEG